MNYKEQLQTKAWREFRKEVINMCEGQCVGCGSNHNLHVHHKTYIKGRKAWQYGTDNMLLLCGDCHNRYHENKKRVELILNDTSLYATGDASTVLDILELTVKVQPHNRGKIIEILRHIIDNQLDF